MEDFEYNGARLAQPRFRADRDMPISSPSRTRSMATGAIAFLGFVLVAIVQSWPLVLNLGTQLTGSPGGDTGAYVWNTWVFSHELRVDRNPLTTSMVLPLDGPTDLSLHNYTLFADILAAPLLPWLGVVTSFNLTFLFNVALAGWCMFLLAKSVTGRPLESWIAGALFACSPFIVARSTAHFSLVAAAALPLFVLCFLRAWRLRRVRDGVAAGAVMAWAAASDPYYGVYCVMLAVLLIIGQLVVAHVTRGDADRWSPAIRVSTNILIGLTTLVILAIYLNPGSMRIGPLSVSMRSLYSPVMLLTLLVGFRLWLGLRIQVHARKVEDLSGLIRTAAIAGVTLIALLSPPLYALGIRAFEGQLVSPPVLWRSSAPGVDLLAFFLPNPNHVLTPQWLVDWIAGQPGGFHEQVSSFTVVALGVVLLASAGRTWHPGRMWVAMAVTFGVLALGPFLRVAGLETLVPTPWAFLRYVPGISEARMPPRFAVVAMLGFCVLFAEALVALGRRWEGRRLATLAAVVVLLAAELLPVSRILYSARIPMVYQVIAEDARPIRVLNLPFGILDGLSGMGNFTAASQFFQTAHGKPIIGGYLSRVPEQTKDYYRKIPTVAALLALSEGRSLTPEEHSAAIEHAGDFLRAAQLGYVVIDPARASPELKRFAVEVLQLTLVTQGEGLELWSAGRTPVAPERPCEPLHITRRGSEPSGPDGCGP
jgi:hypothetical protein